MPLVARSCRGAAHPLRAVPTVLSFAGGFLAVCALVAGSALIGGAGRADPADDAGEVRSWVGVGVGASSSPAP